MIQNNKKFFSGFERDLIKAGISESKEEYLKKNIFYAIALVIFFLFVFLLLAEKLMEGIIYSSIVFVFLIAVIFYYPKMKKKKIASVIERDLPFALMSMAVELNLNIPFEKTMENTARKNYGAVSREFRRVVKEVKEHGSSIQEALLHLSERNDSLMLKRSLSQIVSIYEHGSEREKGEPIKRIAREVLSKQKAESKEFSGKLVVFSLIFIALSAIIPALFQAFISIGSMFLDLDFTASQIIIIVTVVFPAIDLAILVFIKIKTPVFLSEN